MHDAPGNFLAEIHRTDHRAPFESEPPAGADTLLDLGLRPVTSLDGRWHVTLDPYDTCLRQQWWRERYADDEGRPLPVDFSFDEWDTVEVPGCWNTQRPEWLWYEGNAVYTRTFERGGTGGRHVLHVAAAAYAAFVFLNGEYLGWHRGGSTPFCLEVTGLLRATNRLVIVVDAARRPERVPADNTDWFTYGGLFRSVSLVALPDTYVRTATVALRPDGRLATIDVDVTVDGPGGDGTAVVELPALGLRADVPVVAGTGHAELVVPPDLEPWSPAHPRLYDVVVRYGDDEWRDRVGLREIRVEAGEILLNGEPVFLAGVCRHEDSVEHGRSLTEEEVRADLALAKELGCTFVRLAHYPHSDLVARVADEVGLMLWEEVPVYWAIRFDDPETLADAANQVRELVVRDRNRACVVVWSVGNENPDTDARLAFMTRLADEARALDATRLVSAACLVDHERLAIADRLAEVVDVIGVNEYYGWYDPDVGKLERLFENSRPTKPVVITEFGADAVAGLHGPGLFTEDTQLAVYRAQLDVLGRIPYVKGTCPWILADFRSPRRTHARQGYYNRKGLVDETRTRRKAAFGAVQEFYRTR